MNATEFLREWNNKPFFYGPSDCAAFAGDFVERVLGKPNPMHRFEYGDKTGANELIEKGGGLRALVIRELGQPRDGATAVDGDIVIAGITSEMLGICFRGGIWVRTQAGVFCLPKRLALCAWTV